MSNIEKIHRANEFKPNKAIIFYNNEEGEHYIEEARIINNELRAGKPIKKSSFHALGKAVLKEHDKTKPKRELFSDKVLYAEHDMDSSLIVWKWTNRVAWLHFTKSIGLKEGQYPLPNLVFALKDRKDLYVYATKTSKIDSNTRLYKPPFFNILEGQKVCMGNSRLAHEDVSTVNACINTYESLFFDSHFSGIHNGGNIKGNMASLYKELHGKSKGFPNKVLLPIHQWSSYTLETLLGSL